MEPTANPTPPQNVPPNPDPAQPTASPTPTPAPPSPPSIPTPSVTIPPVPPTAPSPTSSGAPYTALDDAFPPPSSSPSRSKKLFIVVAIFAVSMIAVSSLVLISAAGNNDKQQNSAKNQVIGDAGAETEATTAGKDVKRAESRKITSANVEAECFRYAVPEGTDTSINACSAQSFYRTDDRVNNGKFDAEDWILNYEFADARFDKAKAAFKIDLLDSELAKKYGRTLVSEEAIKVGGLSAYKLVSKESGDYVGVNILVSTENRYAIDGKTQPYFTIDGEYDSTNGSKTFFDTTLASFRWE